MRENNDKTNSTTQKVKQRLPRMTTCQDYEVYDINAVGSVMLAAHHLVNKCIDPGGQDYNLPPGLPPARK